jgi:simple sugar transport system ATP-binding protein
MADLFLKMTNVSKHYTGVTALDQVDFEIYKGEIHCLVGENGSGKSTLIKIISGTVHPDDGAQIEVEGQVLHGLHAIDAIHKGIDIIYQDLSLFPNLTVMENIALGRYIAEGRRLVDWGGLKKIASKAMARINVSLPLQALVSDIPIGDQQLVAICRALTRDVKLVIMDEPTASLTKKEVDSLFSVVLDMKKKGISTMFVSHKLNEVLEIADRVTVIRDGKKVGIFDPKELNDEKLTQLMTGKKLEYTPFVRAKAAQEPILEVVDLSAKGLFQDISFKLYPGEILGITGLLGSGRTELTLALFGVNKPDSGEIFFEGRPTRIRSIQQAIALGIAFVPEDRLVQGLILNQSVNKNLIVTTLDELVDRFKLLDRRLINERILKAVKDLAIRIPSLDSPVQTLSGGNQQRVVLAKWIATQPKVLILDGPTIGIDVAAKHAIHQIIRELAGHGIAILLVSDEIPEVYNNANRVLVMHKGRLVKEFEMERTSMEEIQETVNLTV